MRIIAAIAAAALSLGLAVAPVQASEQEVAPALQHLVDHGLAVADSEVVGGVAVDGEAVLAIIDQIPAGSGDQSGYSQGAFKFWSDLDGNRIDSRNETLGRDLDDVRWDTKGGQQVVVSGVLHDLYTGEEIPFLRGEESSGKVQIDHIVPRSVAWAGGARNWTAAQREEFANDPEEIIAVKGRANSSKSDLMPSEWMPSNAAFHCAYVASIAYVLGKYELALPQADLDAMRSTASGCSADAPAPAQTPTADAQVQPPAQDPEGGIPPLALVVVAVIALVVIALWMRRRDA